MYTVVLLAAVAAPGQYCPPGAYCPPGQFSFNGRFGGGGFNGQFAYGGPTISEERSYGPMPYAPYAVPAYQYGGPSFDFRFNGGYSRPFAVPPGSGGGCVGGGSPFGAPMYAGYTPQNGGGFSPYRPYYGPQSYAPPWRGY